MNMDRAEGRLFIIVLDFVVTFEDIDTSLKVEYFFNLRATAMATMMANFGMILGVPHWDLRFLHNGRRINIEDTAFGLELEFGDTIEVFREQAGIRV